MSDWCIGSGVVYIYGIICTIIGALIYRYFAPPQNKEQEANDLCECGHPKEYHMKDFPHKSRCQEPSCKCKRFVKTKGVQK